MKLHPYAARGKSRISSQDSSDNIRDCLLNDLRRFRFNLPLLFLVTLIVTLSTANSGAIPVKRVKRHYLDLIEPQLSESQSKSILNSSFEPSKARSSSDVSNFDGEAAAVAGTTESKKKSEYKRALKGDVLKKVKKKVKKKAKKKLHQLAHSANDKLHHAVHHGAHG